VDRYLGSQRCETESPVERAAAAGRPGPRRVGAQQLPEAPQRRLLDGGSGALTSISWQPPSSITFEQWVSHGRRLGTIGRGVGWWIGDWLRFGNGAYGEKYVPAARITGYDVQTLMNMVYVASRIEPSRRREKLSWSHHAEVAALAPEDQDACLLHAEQQRFSVNDLRVQLRQQRNREAALAASDPAPPKPVTTCPSCGHTFCADGRMRLGRGHADLPRGIDADAA
jgi:hypothetical protein